MISILLFGSVVIAVTFLFLASYSRVETVQGAIVPGRGIVEIVPSRPGLVASMAVQDGSRVRAGDPLVTVRAAETTIRGSSVQNALGREIARQDQGLVAQLAQIQAAASAEQARIDAQISGLGDEIRSLDEQISVQREMVESARSELENVREVAARGFISHRELQAREDTYLNRRQQLSQLQQARSAKASSMQEARRTSAEAAARARSQMSSIESSRAELAQRLVGIDVTGTYVLASPIDGVVTALTARIGQAVNEQALMVVVPSSGRFRAELYVPTRAAGFLEAGQEVRLAVDAFPYQQFGTVNGVVERISSAPVQRRNMNGVDEPVYLVAVRLTEPGVTARGRTYRLISGMTLSARIVIQRQSLFEWLFEPLLAVSTR